MSAGAPARFGLVVGSDAGPYRIVDELGGGGMGRVYLAEHRLLGRRAAVKVLLPHLGGVPEVVQRFFDEARATTLIRHPGIVEIYDFGHTDAGAPFIVMEYLEGVSLGDRVAQARRLPVVAALVLARRISSALSAAHAAGVVHRDLKPDNVFLVADPDGGAVDQVKLLDFGIAKLALDGVEASRRTSTGVMLGTPLYMSPEQCRGAVTCDARTDLYALGCVIFEMITGRPPFVGSAPHEVIAAHLAFPPPALRTLDPGVPVEVDALVARLLAKEPADRPASATIVTAELDALLEVLAPPRRSAMLPTVMARTGPVPPAREQAMPTTRVRRPLTRLVGVLLAAGGAAALVAGLLLSNESPAPLPAPPRPPDPPPERAEIPSAPVRAPVTSSTSPPVPTSAPVPAPAPAPEIDAGITRATAPSRRPKRSVDSVLSPGQRGREDDIDITTTVAP